jgi:hypothetical protein
MDSLKPLGTGTVITSDNFFQNMKMKLLSTALAVVLLAFGFTARAQDSKPADSKPPSAAPAPKLTQEELEAKFKATLTQATMSGRWCGLKDGKLTPEKEDKYTIVSVNKLGGEAWIIHARIQYGEKDFTVPVPVQVKWAGDTPVITVDGMTMPGGKTAYSARVLVYDKTYAGTWSGGDHAGLMNGVITNEQE